MLKKKESVIIKFDFSAEQTVGEGLSYALTVDSQHKPQRRQIPKAMFHSAYNIL